MDSHSPPVPPFLTLLHTETLAVASPLAPCTLPDPSARRRCAFLRLVAFWFRIRYLHAYLIIDPTVINSSDFPKEFSQVNYIENPINKTFSHKLIVTIDYSIMIDDILCLIYRKCSNYMHFSHKTKEMCICIQAKTNIQKLSERKKNVRFILELHILTIENICQVCTCIVY